jgi:hypothetical protein
VLLGLAYGLCLVSGLRQAELLAGPRDRGAVVACYLALSYLGFAMAYAIAALNSVVGRPGAFVALAGIAAALTAWMTLQSRRSRALRPAGDPAPAASDTAELASSWQD